MAKALLIYANGSEDLEITAPCDVLKRGGVQVTKAAICENHGKEVTLAHGTHVVCDCNIEDVTGAYDVIVVPGGLPGANYCHDSAKLTALLKEQKAQGRYLAAICAAPGFVLAAHGLIGDEKATGYPGCESGIANYTGAGVEVVADAHLITGKGPGYALDFALAILEVLTSRQTADQVAAGMLYERRV
ncbi:MAG: DJ-1/PfpI family protein [Succinivibrio sp.]|nr:DJ-1/PfpI family protein [Succinivibrio sp.]